MEPVDYRESAEVAEELEREEKPSVPEGIIDTVETIIQESGSEGHEERED